MSRRKKKLNTVRTVADCSVLIWHPDSALLFVTRDLPMEYNADNSHTDSWVVTDNVAPRRPLNRPHSSLPLTPPVSLRRVILPLLPTIHPKVCKILPVITVEGSTG